MHADSWSLRWTCLLLAVALLATGCTSLTPPPGRGVYLSDSPHVASGPALAQQRSEAPTLASSPSSPPEPEEPPPLYRRRDSREYVTSAAPVSTAGTGNPGALTRQAVLGVTNDVWGSLRELTDPLSKLSTRHGRPEDFFNGLLASEVDYGSKQVPWINSALVNVTTLAEAAEGVSDPDMEQGLLRLSGPRLQAALFGTTLLATWVDFLQLSNTVLDNYRSYSAERLIRKLYEVQKLIEPTLAELASQDPRRVEAAARAMPELMEQLSREYDTLREEVRVSLERFGYTLVAMQFIETLTTTAAMKMMLPRSPPAAPIVLGTGLVVGSGGVMMGTQIIVSAEWVERLRRLVQAGVLSVPTVSAAVRIQAGQVLMMSQGYKDLPQGVRDALGEGPEVQGMHETGRAGAGMGDPPQHHVLSREYRAWFEQRGFKGDMDIDQFCVELEVARHQAIHGGGNWRLGRTWPGEWNRKIMSALRDAEAAAGRMLTRKEILDIVARYMKEYGIPMNFTPWRGR
jgi:hypothetical protein